MSRNANELQGVSQLGAAKTAYPTDYAPQLLETFANKHPDNDSAIMAIFTRTVSILL